MLRISVLLMSIVFMTRPLWCVTVSSNGDTPLYGTYELSLAEAGVSGNKFTVFPAVTFSRGGRSFAVEGFYDGSDTWRARFMPDTEGEWAYAWSFNGESGTGAFTCTAMDGDYGNHGHVHRDPDHPRYLAYDDGSPHYWFGGKWISTNEYGPASKDGETNTGQGDNEIVKPTSDAEFAAYLDLMETYRHNGLLLKIRLYPLEADKLSWDLDGWVRRAEWLLTEMGKRGIYCQVNIFGTWGRCADSWFNDCTKSSEQVFDAWASGDEAFKENYIRYLVARFSGFYNVYWELGNEVGHSPNSGAAFVAQANAKYIPWIRQYDPYGLPIGLSEGEWTSSDADIGFLHQSDQLTPANPAGNRPTIMNELVAGCGTGSLWKDEVMRNGSARLCYRRTFWRMFTYGGCGSSEATWLRITEPPDTDALNVMGDQMRFRNFLDKLTVPINEMDRTSSVITAGPGSYSCRAKAGEAYVCYFLGSSSGTDVELDLPDGAYTAFWYGPASGTMTGTGPVNGGSGTRLACPAFSDDLALMLLYDGPADTTQPDPDPVETFVTDLSVSGSAYPYETGPLAVGTEYYTDRDYTLRSPLPAAFDGGVLVKTPNDDKANTAATVFTVTVDTPVTAYLCVDARGAADAAWMTGYAATGLTVATDDVDLAVYERSVGPGGIVFGGNHNDGNTGAGSNYIVVLVPAETVSGIRPGAVPPHGSAPVPGVLFDQRGNRVLPGRAVPGVYFTCSGNGPVKVLVTD